VFQDYYRYIVIDDNRFPSVLLKNLQAIYAVLFKLLPLDIKDFIKELREVFDSVETQKKITGSDREIPFNYFLD
jgi:hypothetical protein